MKAAPLLDDVAGRAGTNVPAINGADVAGTLTLIAPIVKMSLAAWAPRQMSSAGAPPTESLRDDRLVHWISGPALGITQLRLRVGSASDPQAA
jgi:hypothetical protein